VANIAVVKPDKAEKLEMILIQVSQNILQLMDDINELNSRMPKEEFSKEKLPRSN
jgi:hypothetical protein